MKQGRTVEALGAELLRRENTKRDFLAPAANLSVRSNGHTDLVLADAYAVNEVTHGQLASYLDIPKVYYDKLRSGTESLRVGTFDDRFPHIPISTPVFDVVVNSSLTAKGPDRRMIRTLDNSARAFLSDSYNPDLDNYDVLLAAAAAIEQAGLSPENVLSCEVTDRRMYLKVVSPKVDAIIQPSNLHLPHGDHHMLREPEVIQAGFVLSNSETGLGSLAIQPVVYKLKCTNLWTIEEALRQRHLGRTLEAKEDGTVYKSDTRRAEATVKLMKIRDHIADAIDVDRFRALADKIQETAQVKLEGAVEKIVEVTARKFGLTIAEKESTLKHLIEGASLSLWGLTNAITAVAQDATDYDRASELEAIGGKFFSLTRGEIGELVRAA